MEKRKREKGRKRSGRVSLVRRKQPWRWRPPYPHHCAQLYPAAAPSDKGKHIHQLNTGRISSKAIRLPGATGSEDNGDVIATSRA